VEYQIKEVITVPKLTPQTMKMRVSCPYCDKTFRAGQGLSGHIRFKHAIGTVKKKKASTDWDIDTNIYEKLLESCGVSKTEISELSQVRKDWAYIRALMEDKNHQINNADFKAYQIVAYIHMLSNRRLKEWLAYELETAIQELAELNSEIMTKKLQGQD
jgi:hypothetical protein